LYRTPHTVVNICKKYIKNTQKGVAKSKNIAYYAGMDGKDIRKIMGASLKEIRATKNLTQEQLAELIGKQKNTINRIETGVHFADSETFADLCNALNIPPAVLLTAKPSYMLKEHNDYIKAITQLLQTFPLDNLNDAYKILIRMSKYFT